MRRSPHPIVALFPSGSRQCRLSTLLLSQPCYGHTPSIRPDRHDRTVTTTSIFCNESSKPFLTEAVFRLVDDTVVRPRRYHRGGRDRVLYDVARQPAAARRYACCISA